MRMHALVSMTVLVAAAAAQSNDPLTELIDGYPDVHKVTARQLVTEAMAQGLVTTPGERMRAKALLRARHEKKAGRPGRPHGAARPDHDLFGSVGEQASVIDEAEYNDTPGFANRIGSSATSVRGVLGFDDFDVFHFVMDQPGVLTASVDPFGPAPASDPGLLLTTANGAFVAFDDDAGGTLYPRIDVQVPAGVYFLTVERIAGSGGGYTLSVSRMAATPPRLAANTTVSANLPSPLGATYSLYLPTASTLDITATSGPLDLALQIQTADGGSYYFVDDTGAGLDPRFVGALPAGLYFLTVTEFFAGLGPYTIRANVTPGMPAAPCGGSMTGTLLGSESVPLFSLSVPSPQGVRLATAGNGPLPVDDTFLLLFDAELNLIAFNDDFGSPYSQIEVPLPAGTYQLAVIGFSGSSGGFRLDTTCGLPIDVTPIEPGAVEGFVSAPGATTAFALTANTPAPWQIGVDTSAGTLPDPVLTVLDGQGRVVVFNDDFLTLDSRGGNALLPGTHWVLVREYSDETGTFRLSAEPPLWYARAGAQRTPTARGHAGDFTALLASVRGTRPQQLFPGYLYGYVLIDLTMAAVVGTRTIPATGQFTWPVAPAGFGGVLQSVTFAGGDFPASLSEVVR